MNNPEKLATQGTQDDEKHNTICVGHHQIRNLHFYYRPFQIISLKVGLWCRTPLSTIFQLDRGAISLKYNVEFEYI